MQDLQKDPSDGEEHRFNITFKIHFRFLNVPQNIVKF